MGRSLQVAWALLLIYGFVIAIYSAGPAFGPDGTPGFFPGLYSKPLQEDGFYALTIAWNLAHGDGVAVNHGSVTTGFQPLYTIGVQAMLAKCAVWLGYGKEDFPRFILAAGAVNFVLLSHLIGLIAGKLTRRDELRRLGYVLAGAATCSSFYLFRLCTSGMETGAYLSLFAVIVVLSLSLFSRSAPTQRLDWAKAAQFGVLVGLTGLARIDFGVIFATTLGFVALQRRASLSWCIAAGLIALLVVSPWFFWVHHVSGEWMPSSGTAESSLINFGPDAEPPEDGVSRTRMMVSGIIENLAPWIYIGFYFPAGSLTQVCSLLAVLLFGRTKRESGRNDELAVIGLWYAGIAVVTIVYYLLFWSSHFYDRYTSPLIVVTIPLLAVFVAPSVAALSPRLRIGIPYSVPLLFYLFSWLSLHNGKPPHANLVRSAGYVRDHVSSTAKVGAFQSGLIGYVNSNVVNLDGKVNSEVLPYHMRGAVEEYVDEQNIDVLIDWGRILRKHLSASYLDTYWTQCLPAIELDDNVVCLERRLDR